MRYEQRCQCISKSSPGEAHHCIIIIKKFSEKKVFISIKLCIKIAFIFCYACFEKLFKNSTRAYVAHYNVLILIRLSIYDTTEKLIVCDQKQGFQKENHSRKCQKINKIILKRYDFPFHSLPLLQFSLTLLYISRTSVV